MFCVCGCSDGSSSNGGVSSSGSCVFAVAVVAVVGSQSGFSAAVQSPHHTTLSLTSECKSSLFELCPNWLLP